MPLMVTSVCFSTSADIPCGQGKIDGMGITEIQDQVIALELRPVPDAHDLQLLLEAL